MSALFSKPKYYRPGFGGSLLILLVLFVGGGIVSALVSFVAAMASGQLTPEVLSDPQMLTEIIAGKLSLMYFAQMIVPVLFIWLVGNARSHNPMVSPVKVDAPHIGKFNFLTLGLLLMFLTLAVGWVLDPVTSYFPIPDSFKSMFENISNKPFDTILSVAIMAPLFEEFILRGTIERGLLSGSSWVAILWSALLFGVIHMNFWQAIPAFIIGCLLGWVYYRTHSIWAVIFMHFVNNFSSIMLYWVLPEMDAEASSRENMKMLTGTDLWYWVLVGGGVVITVLGIVLLNKYLPKKPQSFKPKEVLMSEQMTSEPEA